MSNVFKGVLIFLGVIALFVGIMFVSGLVSIATAPFRGEVEKHELVEADGSYRIAAYDQFYQMCSSVQSHNDKIKVLENEMKNSSDEERIKQLQSGITANQNTKAELVNDYNTKAASEYTKGQMKDSDLPDRLSVDDKEVVCTAN